MSRVITGTGIGEFFYLDGDDHIKNLYEPCTEGNNVDDYPN